jgi:tRNA A37 threonylcarbamoyladenosine synthetase subunit TsaC/SUA5/YrdC
LLDFIDELGEPVVSTSANHSGKPPMENVEDIQAAFGRVVDLLVCGTEKREGKGAASTVVDFTGERPSLLRLGDYAWGTGGGNPSK